MKHHRNGNKNKTTYKNYCIANKKLNKLLVIDVFELWYIFFDIYVYCVLIRPRRAGAGTRIDEDMVESNTFGLTWTQHDSILILSSEETRKGNKKIAAFDMDG